MVEFDIKVDEKQGTAYFKKEIREALGLKLKAIPNEASMLVYRAGLSIDDVIRSVENILSVLKHRKKLKKETNST